MRTSTDPPPNWEQLRGAFPILERLDVRQKVVFTWGDTMHIPKDYVPTPDILAHESTHSQQQDAAGGPQAWWDRYCVDPRFRYEQELEAYRAQYRSACEAYPDRRVRKIIAKAIAGALCGRIYGNCATYKVALRAVTR